MHTRTNILSKKIRIPPTLPLSNDEPSAMWHSFAGALLATVGQSCDYSWDCAHTSSHAPCTAQLRAENQSALCAGSVRGPRRSPDAAPPTPRRRAPGGGVEVGPV